MKIWNSYGSEHSMNLVMVGQFRNVEDAEKTIEIFNALEENLAGKIDVGDSTFRFSDEVMDVLRDQNVYSLSRPELEQFLYSMNTEHRGDKIVLRTDETEVSAFLKIMIEKGAKVEVYSAHEYPDTEHGR